MNIHELIEEILRGDKVFLDSETCGFHSMPVLLQWAVDDGPIHLYNVWKHSFTDTICLLEAIAQRDLIGFNLSFDAFHLCKLYTVWKCFTEKYPNLLSVCNNTPEEYISLIADCEEAAMSGPCWKPRNALDLMLHGRKNEFQTLMNRKDIRIRRVPKELAYALAEELGERIEIPDIYFAKFKKHDASWKVFDRDDDIHFKDVVLNFAPSGGLKYIAEFAIGLKPEFHYEDIAIDKEFLPDEIGYAPTAAGARRKFGDDCKDWTKVIQHHIDHWEYNKDARNYADFDIVCTRGLYDYFAERTDGDQFKPGDDDSELACMVAAVRWRGFEIDMDGIKELLVESKKVVESSPVNINSANEVRAYLSEVMDPIEQVLIAESTRKQIIQEITTWTDNDPAVERAQLILDVKIASKEVELYDKLLISRRLHADLNVIGTKSSRMSGGGGLNVQGIKNDKIVRRQFPLSDTEMTLSGGDFDSFEVTLADAVYGDPELRQALLSGKKIHGMFGMCLYPGKTYDEILASDGTANDMYTKAKSGVFALIYGGNANTLSRNLGVPMEDAEHAYAEWQRMFPGIGAAMARINDMFMALSQPNGIGTAITWKTPSDYVETKDGFRRYFTLENMAAEQLFKLAQAPPKKWKDCKVKVARRDRLQTASGAVQSALYGAAFGILSANVRAAANHEIQSLGATICKRVQRAVWDLQPSGINEFQVMPLNVHDEILTPTTMVDEVTTVVEQSVESHRDMVPLIGLTWNKEMANWAEKKGGAVTVNIGPLKNPELCERMSAEII